MNRLLPLLNVFSERFCEVNPQIEISRGKIVIKFQPENFDEPYVFFSPCSESSNFFFFFFADNICLLCLSLCLLSVDMTNPHVRNKMSKREFVRSNREWLPGQDEFLGARE